MINTSKIFLGIFYAILTMCLIPITSHQHQLLSYRITKNTSLHIRMLSTTNKPKFIYLLLIYNFNL